MTSEEKEKKQKDKNPANTLKRSEQFPYNEIHSRLTVIHLTEIEELLQVI
jgi:hypothetical protein